MAHQLAGKRVLIVEDEQMLANAMAAEGAEVIGDRKCRTGCNR
jgi:hypothetical protein